MGGRSRWKVPAVDYNLLKKLSRKGGGKSKAVLKVHCRASVILPDFVGRTICVYNGRRYIPVCISEEMVGHKLGEFSPTRTYTGHNFDNKNKK